VLREEGVDVEQGVGEREEAFFNDAVSALAALPSYGSPFYLQLTGFQQVEASGLQVTHSGGVSVVYTGFALLVIGVFIMFYTSHRRVWAWLAIEEGIDPADSGRDRQPPPSRICPRVRIGLRAMFERRLGPSEEERFAPSAIPSTGRQQRMSGRSSNSREREWQWR
jgi:cytochrome c biogenesis protein ResB